MLHTVQTFIPWQPCFCLPCSRDKVCATSTYGAFCQQCNSGFYLREGQCLTCAQNLPFAPMPANW